MVLNIALPSRQLEILLANLGVYVLTFMWTSTSRTWLFKICKMLSITPPSVVQCHGRTTVDVDLTPSESTHPVFNSLLRQCYSYNTATILDNVTVLMHAEGDIDLTSRLTHLLWDI